MKIVHIDDIAKESFVAPIFTGADVKRQPLTPDSSNFSMNFVTFGMTRNIIKRVFIN